MLAFQTAMAYLWTKTPDIIKWPVTFVVVIALTPIMLKDYVISFVREEVHAAISPIKIVHDREISDIKVNMRETNDRVWAIGVHLMGESKMERMTANAGSKNKEP